MQRPGLRPSLRTPRIASCALILTIAGARMLPAVDGDEVERVATNIAELFRAARAVISENQDLINDPAKGDKGLSGAKVVALARDLYRKQAVQDLAAADASTLQGRAQAALLDAVAEVMDKAQPLINEAGKGFKGFLPAVFARQVAEIFSARMAGRISIKLTAPKAYVRNRANRPDEWESNAIETKLRSPSWERGKPFAERAPHRGQESFRLIIPEYYTSSCLGCHGEPKGGKDITGGTKEGARLDELGGAISVVVKI